MERFCHPIFSRMAKPSFQSLRPDAALICPALPILINSLPHFLAKNAARSRLTRGVICTGHYDCPTLNSFQGKWCKTGNWKWYRADSGSLGATSNAPLIVFLNLAAQ